MEDEFDRTLIEALSDLAEGNDIDVADSIEEINSTRTDDEQNYGRKAGEVTGYNLFFRVSMKKIKRIHPDLEFSIISKMVGELWKKAPLHVKEDCTSRAKTINEERKKEEGKFVCKICNWEFSKEASLRSHAKDHGKSFVCKECGRNFSLQKFLQSHRKDKHGEKVFACSTCNKAFASKFRLNEHAKIHSNERYECKICEHSFSTVSNLNKHLKKQH